MNDDAAISMVQRFWDSAMALGPLDDEIESQSQIRLLSSSGNSCFRKMYTGIFSM